jgi:hypothetical protein
VPKWENNPERIEARKYIKMSKKQLKDIEKDLQGMMVVEKMLDQLHVSDLEEEEQNAKRLKKINSMLVEN